MPDLTSLTVGFFILAILVALGLSLCGWVGAIAGLITFIALNVVLGYWARRPAKQR